MPIPSLPTPPDEATLRRLVRSTTIRPVDRAPAYVRGYHVLANAAGWGPGWTAAAVFMRRYTSVAGQRIARAELVVADGAGTQARPTQWYHATLAEWPAPPTPTTPTTTTTESK